MEYSKFTSYCDKKICLRKSFYNSNTCIKEYKREVCFSKYEKSLEKQFENLQTSNLEEENFKRDVWVRDYGYYPDVKRVKDWKEVCRYWKSLTFLEQQVIERIHSDNLYMNQDIDVAHIKGKGSHADLRYLPSNGVLIGRLFHFLIDTNIDPVTNSFMNKNSRTDIFERILSVNSN